MGILFKPSETIKTDAAAESADLEMSDLAKRDVEKPPAKLEFRNLDVHAIDVIPLPPEMPKLTKTAEGNWLEAIRQFVGALPGESFLCCIL